MLKKNKQFIAAAILVAGTVHANATDFTQWFCKGVDTNKAGWTAMLCRRLQAAKTLGDGAGSATADVTGVKVSDSAKTFGGFLGQLLAERAVSATNGKSVDLSDCAGAGALLARDLMGKPPTLQAFATAVVPAANAVSAAVDGWNVNYCTGTVSLYSMQPPQETWANVNKDCWGVPDLRKQWARIPSVQRALDRAEESIHKNYVCGK